MQKWKGKKYPEAREICCANYLFVFIKWTEHIGNNFFLFTHKYLLFRTMFIHSNLVFFFCFSNWMNTTIVTNKYKSLVIIAVEKWIW